jgi:hypothetical protein
VIYYQVFFLRCLLWLRNKLLSPQLIQPAGVQVNMANAKNGFRSLVLVVSLLGLAAAQTPSAVSDGEALPPVAITHGPVVESVAASTAIIAWSTNVNSGTTLRYGTDPNHLDQTASMPWGGFTHRVYLKGLQPATKYFFQAESAKAQGTGTSATAQVMSFETKESPVAGGNPVRTR